MIIVVSEIYYPEEVSTGFILTKIAEGLALEHEVSVVTGPPDYSGKKSVPKYEIRNNVKINRIKVKSLNKNNLLLRLLRSILLSIKLTLKTITLAKKGDTIFIVTNPAPLLLIMTLVSKIKKTKLVILVHDVFPENLNAANILKKETLFFKVLLKIFNKIYRSADHIVVIGRDMDKIIRKKINNASLPTTLITNWADIDDIRPEPRFENKLLKELRLENNFVVQFAGNLGRVQGIDQMVEAAEILKNSNFHMLFIGDGARKKWIVEQKEKRNLKNITTLPFLPRKEQNNFLNACDLCLVSLAPGMTGLGVPSKTYNVLAAGKPIVAIVDRESEIGMLVSEHKLGWVVEPGDSKALSKAIVEAMNSKDFEDISKRARQLAETEYSQQNIILKYTNLFKKL